MGPFFAVSIAAVTLNDRFLTSITLCSLSRFIPANSTCLVPCTSCVVDAAIAGNLEVLQIMALRRACLIEAVPHAGALDR